MGYEHDMSKESERVPLLSEGWHKFEIVECTAETSKASGNDMFKIKIAELEHYQEVTIYAIAVEGKRWFLKQILVACGVKPDDKGIFRWDEGDLIGKVVSGEVTHFDDKWINREGKEVITKKQKIETINILGENEGPIDLGEEPK